MIDSMLGESHVREQCLLIISVILEYAQLKSSHSTACPQMDRCFRWIKGIGLKWAKAILIC